MRAGVVWLIPEDYKHLTRMVEKASKMMGSTLPATGHLHQSLQEESTQYHEGHCSLGTALN